jgi:hypothetical protein
VTTRNAVLEMFLSGAWTSVPLYSAAGVAITRGHEPDGTWPRPTRIECEINNDSLTYDPSRPESALYGVAGRNTKTRVTVDTNARVWAEASSWQPDRTPEHVSGAGRGRSWTRLVAEGVLGRIGTWTDPLRSPMYRTISARPTSIGHWPLEDGRDALLLSNTLAGSPAGTFKGGAALAESESPLGAEQTVKVVAGSQLTGVFASASTTAGWQVVFSAKLAALPSGAGYQSLLTWTTSNGYTWSWTTNNANYFISVVAADGTVLYNNGTAWSTQGPPTEWMTFRLKASVSGGTVTIEPAWYRQSAPVVTGFTDTFAGSVGRLLQWWQVGASYTDGAHYSHVFAVTGLTDALTAGTAIAVFNGYLGEAAGTRFLRLCAEQGITAYMIGASAETALMGPQRTVTFVELLKDIRETDDARIDDERLDIALTMRTRRVMYNQTAALTLAYPSQVAVPFTKLIDNIGAQNRVTVQNRSGGEYTASLLTGRMSVQPPPAGIGEKKGSVDVSVANPATQLEDIATWHRAKGTIERPRYAEVTVDLLANPSLVGAACAVREGDMIAVTGAEAETVRLLVDGIAERVGAATWTITYQVELYDVWVIGVYDDGTWRWDTRTTTLAAGATSSATSLSLTTVDINDVLTTAGGSLPYDLMVDGERVRVTAMTAPAGTGPYTQTATVTRSINGVVKAQVAGGQVNVYDSRRWGL